MKRTKLRKTLQTYKMKTSIKLFFYFAGVKTNMEHVIGIGDLVFSHSPEDTIKTYSLSSCIGVVMYVPGKRIMAMAHMLLPAGGDLKGKTLKRPARYVDTGIKEMILKFNSTYGVETRRLQVSVFGGSDAGLCNHYKVSERNIVSAKDTLARYGIKPVRMDTGGTYARTLTAYVHNGHIHVDRVRIGLKTSV